MQTWLWNFFNTLMDLSFLLFFLNVLIFWPLCIFKKTRLFAADKIVWSGWFFGVSIWGMSVFYTYNYWGVTPLVIGLLIFGVGVVPMGIIVTIANGLWFGLFELLFGSSIAILSQQLGRIMIYKELFDRRNNGSED